MIRFSCAVLSAGLLLASGIQPANADGNYASPRTEIGIGAVSHSNPIGGALNGGYLTFRNTLPHYDGREGEPANIRFDGAFGVVTGDDSGRRYIGKFLLNAGGHSDSGIPIVIHDSGFRADGQIAEVRTCAGHRVRLDRRAWLDVCARVPFVGGAIFDRTTSDNDGYLASGAAAKLTVNASDAIQAYLESEADVLFMPGAGTYFRSGAGLRARIGERVTISSELVAQRMDYTFKNEDRELETNSWTGVQGMASAAVAFE